MKFAAGRPASSASLSSVMMPSTYAPGAQMSKRKRGTEVPRFAGN
jgi:hypothetical protein